MLFLCSKDNSVLLKLFNKEVFYFTLIIKNQLKKYVESKEGPYEHSTSFRFSLIILMTQKSVGLFWDFRLELS